MTDGQIVDERFLVYINDMLSSGNIPDLFAREEYDVVFSTIRNAAKFAGYSDDRDSLFQYFVDKVRKNLHLILCHSPVGSAFRIRGRKFPALISFMVLDVFHAWPKDALLGVAAKFLQELRENNIRDDEMLTSVSVHMAEVHLSIDGANRRFLEEERRYNATTPKSFLELISFYIRMLKDKQANVNFNIQRLEKGLDIMVRVQERVATLKADLERTVLKVEQQKASTDAIIKQVTVASSAAAEERLAASKEEAKCSALAAEAQKVQHDADVELQDAMPAMEKAKAAVDCLDKASIQELKALPKPPAECIDVVAACGFLLKQEKRKLDWKGCVKLMANPAQFLEEVKAFDANNILDAVLSNTEPLLEKSYFNFDTMKSKSYAAACLANWVVNIVSYNKLYKRVAPLMAKLKSAKQQVEVAEGALSIVRKRVQEVEDHCAALDDKLKEAVAAKEAGEAQAARCLERLSLAERLVSGLADENTRWAKSATGLQDLGFRLIGNCLLASAFVGYASPFSARLRLELWQGTWIKDLVSKQIPMTNNIDPLSVLASDADVASWQNEGLPADRISVENASVLTSCTRWPLLIDPQQQGVRWIKQRVGDDLVVLHLTSAKWLERVVMCVQSGSQLLLEHIGEEIDAVLEPVLSRAIIKRARQGNLLRLGGEEAITLSI